MTKPTQVKSPCIHVCILNDSDVCTGCFRTGQEISNWGRMTEEEKFDVIRAANKREQESDSTIFIQG